MKKLFLGILFFTFFYSKAQHCGFDGASIIVVHVHQKNDLKTIPNLRITIVNEKGIDVFVKDTTRSFQQSLKFPFLKDEYAFEISSGFDMDNLYLKIENFPQSNHIIKVKLYDNDLYRLCGNYNDEIYSYNIGGRVFKPIEVIF